MKIKMKIVACSLIMMSFSAFIVPMSSKQSNAVASEVEARTDITGWRYQVIDGHLYKRLYNYSTGRWETDWILVE